MSFPEGAGDLLGPDLEEAPPEHDYESLGATGEVQANLAASHGYGADTGVAVEAGSRIGVPAGFLDDDRVAEGPAGGELSGPETAASAGLHVADDASALGLERLLDQPRLLSGQTAGEGPPASGDQTVDQSALSAQSDEDETGAGAERIAGTVEAQAGTPPPDSQASSVPGEHLAQTEDTKSLIASSDALVARSAAGEVERLETLLPDVEDPQERALIKGAIERLSSTAALHQANLPLEASDKSPTSALLNVNDDAKQPGEVTPSRPFVSVREQQALRSDAEIEQAVEDKDALLRQANSIGDRIRSAALNKSPAEIGRRDKVVNWVTADETLPGSAYRFTARYTREGDHPSLTTIACAHVPDVAADTPSARAVNFGVNAFTHPVTVAASFDGPSLAKLELSWPHWSITADRNKPWTTGQQLGPTWDRLVAEDEGKLLGKLVGIAEGDVGVEGCISLDFQDSPTLSIRARNPGMEAGNGLQSLHNWMIRVGKVGPQETTFLYNAPQNAYLRRGQQRMTPGLSAAAVVRLTENLGRFFPVLD